MGKEEYVDVFESFVLVQNIQLDLVDIEKRINNHRISSAKSSLRGIKLLDELLKRIVSSPPDSIFRIGSSNKHTHVVPDDNIVSPDTGHTCSTIESDVDNCSIISSSLENLSKSNVFDVHKESIKSKTNEISIGQLLLENSISLPSDLAELSDHWAGSKWVESHFWQKRMRKYEEIIKFRMQTMYVILTKCILYSKTREYQMLGE